MKCGSKRGIIAPRRTHAVGHFQTSDHAEIGLVNGWSKGTADARDADDQDAMALSIIQSADRPDEPSCW
jgi:hypothetical protein